ncbi:MAG: L-rhamnose mutarotase [Rhodoglobus sp.]
MQTVAIHTRLKAEAIDEYEAVHAVIPPELDSALRRAGVKSWKIWRSGQDLFHWVEVESWDAMEASLATEPADIAWQPRIALLLEAGAGGANLPLVWELPTRPAQL